MIPCNKFLTFMALGSIGFHRLQQTWDSLPPQPRNPSYSSVHHLGRLSTYYILKIAVPMINVIVLTLEGGVAGESLASKVRSTVGFVPPPRKIT